MFIALRVFLSSANYLDYMQFSIAPLVIALLSSPKIFEYLEHPLF